MQRSFKMTEYFYALEPNDLLFLRDARPMEASDAGLGANWPRPDQVWSAVINALHRQWPERQSWEMEKWENTRYKNKNFSDRFTSLKSFGPYPLKNGELYLPLPLDWDMQLVSAKNSNLPQPLAYAFQDRVLGKKEYPQWIKANKYLAYLKGETPELKKESEKEKLYFEERYIGIAIDSQTKTTAKSQLYQAEYLRLNLGTKLYFSTECTLKNGTDIIKKFDGKNLIIGGQQGLAEINKTTEINLPKVDSFNSRYLRWTLISPAIFRNGWLPDFCVDSRKNISSEDKAALGTVMFKDCNFAKLIAARIGKAFAFSGWCLKTEEAKETTLAVPAGSSYVFDCGTPENAQKLATVLQYPQRRSSELGAKGFGIGLCSSVNI